MSWKPIAHTNFDGSETDNWAPLLAVADVAGGHWPDRARKAVLQCHEEAGDESLVVVLLADIKAIFAEQETDRLSSADLAKILGEIEGHPWSEYGRTGKPLTQNQLSRLLKPLAIASENIRVGDKVLKGYLLERFQEAFERYLAPEGASEPLHRYNADGTRTSDGFRTATPASDVADRKCKKPNNDGGCSGVAVRKGETDGIEGEEVIVQRWGGEL